VLPAGSILIICIKPLFFFEFTKIIGKTNQNPVYREAARQPGRPYLYWS
jgi:hypothetical protein